MRLLPLSEIIAAVLGTDSPSTQAVWRNYSLLTEKFGDEYTVLIDAPIEAMAAVVDAPIAQAIVKVGAARLRLRLATTAFMDSLFWDVQATGG